MAQASETSFQIFQIVFRQAEMIEAREAELNGLPEFAALFVSGAASPPVFPYFVEFLPAHRQRAGYCGIEGELTNGSIVKSRRAVYSL
jgi:hypothetical protein